ncbi:Rhodanese-like protein [Massarina eburnea CBS 473.64]|uniref:Rhodanese-like protein n=1 Tax=Massarina eburnea CBS 473.64 TaxID=1395130 RepID=A0A6A6RX26_9PLEO|nr:Rhodanese-like protein [Massarina eburnea CBS 473.64]
MASRRACQLLPRCTPQVLSTSTKTSALRQCARIGQIAGGKGGVCRVSVGTAPMQKRWIANAFPSNKKSKVYEFADVLAILETPSRSTLLVDVREPAEYNTNTIPMSINIPVASQPDALLISEEEFMDRFGWEKPPKGKEIVFFCKAGVRSSAAAQLAKQAGYENVGEYRGSWLDWEKRGGPGTKSPPAAGGRGEPSSADIKETK